MASLLDQFEREESQRTISFNKSQTSLSPFDDDEPTIFRKVKSNLEPEDTITHAVIANDYIVLAFESNILLRIAPKRSQNQDDVTRIVLNRIVPGVQLTGLFLDPTGSHLLICFSTELLYLNKKYSKPKPVGKLRGQHITALSWFPVDPNSSNDSTTKPVLLGTEKGQIFETELNSDVLFGSGVELYCKQIFDLGLRESPTITGLEYHKLDNSDIFFIIVTTQDRLYQFVGHVTNTDDRPLLQCVFNKYLKTQANCHSLPGFLEHSKLKLFKSNLNSAPAALAWETMPGIYYAKIEYNKANDTLLSNSYVFGYPSDSMPISFLMTEFHLLLLYDDHIAGISLLSQELVFNDHFPEHYGRLIDFAKDPFKNVIWVYSKLALYKYEVHQEDRNVWQFYADKGDFEEAKLYCKNDFFKMSKVLTLQGDDFFSKKQYTSSAICYAESQASYEQTALKFLQVNDSEALKVFLNKKLQGLKTSDKAQITMLTLWIIEILLSQLGELRLKKETRTLNRYNQIKEELHTFLKTDHPKDCVISNRQAVYNLMSSHGDQENLIYLAEMLHDYEKVVNYYINKGESAKALSILKKEANPKMWYTHITSLIQDIPIDTLNYLCDRKISSVINPVLVLPSLMAECDSCPDELIKYLDFCTTELNCQDRAVNNFFLYLLAKHKPEKLSTYLNLQGEELSMVHYDVRYAVRICRQYNRKEACVKLCALLGLWESAVDLALTVNTQLAVQTVGRLVSFHGSPRLARKLWLNIANHVIREQNNISQAMEFLKQCDLIKIEDILPFFPDFTTIDHFKDAICSSLQEYNQHIEDLKREMEDATESAEVIRNEIQSFRTKHTLIQYNDPCNICEIRVTSRLFYSFPCGHNFHSDCLINELLNILDPDITKKLTKALKTVNSRDSKRGEVERANVDVDTILTRQCLFCGDEMIDMITQPFIADNDYEKIRKEWE